MKNLIALWSCTADELAVRCCTSATLDIKYVERRVKDEGLWFLAVTLADYGKVILRWLDRGFVAPSDAQGFKKFPGHLYGLPEFLSGFLGRVFDPRSGVLLDDPDVEAIFALHQLTLMFSKIALPSSASDREVVSRARKKLAMSEYVQTEQDVRAADERLDPSYREDLKRMSAMLFGDLFAKVDRDIYWGRVRPKHGPGAVADKLSSNGKWNQQTWTARLGSIFDAPSTFLHNHRSEWVNGYSHESEWIPGLKERLDILEPEAEMPVKVITVPKTLKTPRIIAIEPTVMQCMQQAILRNFLSALQEDSFLSRVVGIEDQEPNRDLAREGSLSGDLATLDLSEASDRVSNQHVIAMMEDWPHLLGAVQSTRSMKADVPGYGVIPLAKFASMGSALCFPIEAMVFLTIIFLGIERELSAPLSREELIKLFHERVRVFGDDLIVPSEHVQSVVDELTTFGFVVNVGKSFWTGRFRESCGRSYYDGHDISIVKVREVLPQRRSDAGGVIATVKLRNLLYWSGSWQTARWLDRYLEKLLKHFPNVGPNSPLLGRESALGYQFQRLHPNYHSPITKGYYVVAKAPPDHLEGLGALNKCLSRMEEQAPTGFALPRVIPSVPLAIDACESVDSEHLERSGRPERVSIKLGWRPPY